MVHYERRGTAALVTIDRPERRNAVDGATAAALGMPLTDGLALEARLGRERLRDALEGARRFGDRG
jgi:1,4-dihydroxy-2-naphthoyl-CoA synthase